MKKDIGSFVLSLVIAPAFGLVVSLYIFSKFSPVDISSCEIDSALPWCRAVREFELLKWMSVGALAATILLPLAYLIALLSLAVNRTWLANGFPVLVRACLLLLPVVLLAHAALAALVTWEALQFRLMRPNLYIVGGVVAIVGALLLAAVNILSDMRRMLAIVPLRVTGIPLEESRMPELHARVRRIAQKLGAVPPHHIAIGIEPTVFMTSAPVRLRGVGDMPEGETLYVSTVVLRMLDAAELDALLAFELAHFRGPDLAFSRRFAPAQAALVNAVESVDEDTEDNAFMKIAKTPAYGLLSLMLMLLRWRLKKVILEREMIADRATLEVAPAQKSLSMVIKMTVLGSQWQEFRAGLARLMQRGVGRSNIGADYLRRLRESVTKTEPGKLRFDMSAGSTPHPHDAHRTLAERAASLGINAEPQISSIVAAFKVDPPANPALEAIESDVTRIDLDYTRVPGHPVQIGDETDLPAELA